SPTPAKTCVHTLPAPSRSAPPPTTQATTGAAMTFTPAPRVSFCTRSRARRNQKKCSARRCRSADQRTARPNRHGSYAALLTDCSPKESRTLQNLILNKKTSGSVQVPGGLGTTATLPEYSAPAIL